LLIYQLYLVNAWRHVSTVLTAIIRPTCNTDQVQLLRVRAIIVPDVGCKHSRNMSRCIN